MIMQAETIFAAQQYTRIIVGTANCNLNNVALYQKLGFRMYDMKRDFFAQHKKPQYEQGMQAIDFWMFEKNLK